MTTSEVCQICLGKLHILQDNHWKPCLCLKTERTKNALKSAGIDVPESILRGQHYRDQNGTITRIIHATGQGKGLLWLIGEDSILRWRLTNFIMSDLIENGKQVLITDVNTYIDAFLSDKDLRLRRAACSFECLWIKLDFYRKHSWAESLLNSLLLSRTNKLTIVTSQPGFESIIKIEKTVFTLEKISWISN